MFIRLYPDYRHIFCLIKEKCPQSGNEERDKNGRTLENARKVESEIERRMPILQHQDNIYYMKKREEVHQ